MALKKDISVAEKKLIARNERIQNLETLLQDSQERLAQQNERFAHQMNEVRCAFRGESPDDGDAAADDDGSSCAPDSNAVGACPRSGGSIAARCVLSLFISSSRHVCLFSVIRCRPIAAAQQQKPAGVFQQFGSRLAKPLRGQGSAPAPESAKPVAYVHDFFTSKPSGVVED